LAKVMAQRRSGRRAPLGGIRWERADPMLQRQAAMGGNDDDP
jgi:hypothetical protein